MPSERERLEQQATHAEEKGNFNSAAHQMLAQIEAATAPPKPKRGKPQAELEEAKEEDNGTYDRP